MLISNCVSLSGIRKNCFVIDGEVSRFMIKIGFGWSKLIAPLKSHLFIEKNCKLIFKGNTSFGPGLRIVINNGSIYFGQDFYANKKLFISSDNSIIFNDNALIAGM